MRLKKFCVDNDIPLEYVDVIKENNEKRTLGQIHYHSLGGRLILDRAKIEVLNELVESPYVLTHEIGHYISIKNNCDESEEGADRIAYEFIKDSLTEDELLVADRWMRCYLYSLN